MFDERVPLIVATQKLIDTLGADYAFPAGGAYDFPTAEEGAVLSCLQSTSLSPGEVMDAISSVITCWSDGYTVAICGIRIAILARNTADVDLFRLGLYLFVAVGSKFDWRDAQRSMSVLFNCAEPLELSLNSELCGLLKLRKDERFRTTVAAFFAGPSDQGNLGRWSIAKIQTKDGVTFRGTRCGW